MSLLHQSLSVTDTHTLYIELVLLLILVLSLFYVAYIELLCCYICPYLWLFIRCYFTLTLLTPLCIIYHLFESCDCKVWRCVMMSTWQMKAL